MSPKDLVFVAAAMVATIISVISDCEVLVREPWPMPHILVPNGSNVEIYCRAATDSDESPVWGIDLAADSSVNSPLQFSTRKRRLNDHGVYELPQIQTPLTLRLLINNTAINNQTEIQCERGESITTVLHVLDPIALTLKILDADVSFINLTWDLSVGDEAQIFLLTIGHGSTSDTMSLNESYYYFTAPEGAPPCEVYNFSVTATSVGATYTGAGCSVPSPVLSTMLPSLPIIDRLESSFNYVLSKKSGGLSLQVSFEPASYCENYPIANYTLVINSSFNDELLESMLAIHADNLIFDAGNLSENAEYSFRILVANTVGIVSTNNAHFYTTDVQRVVATLSNGINASTLQCEFITSSNATGCMVVLTSEDSQKVQYNLIRNYSTISEVLNVTLEHPPSCYTGVKAYDIESDGSVGTLPVPGKLMVYSQAPCAPPLSVVPGSSGSDLTIIGVVAALSVIALFVLSAIIIALIIKHKAKKVSSVGVVPSQSELSTREQIDGGFGLTEQVDSGSHEDIEQSSWIGDDSIQPITPDDAVRGRETTYCDTTDNGVSEETTAIVKGEDIYSEIPPTASQSGGGGGAVAMDSDFRSTREPVRGRQAEEEGGRELEETEAAAAGVPPEEALYEQPCAALERTPGDGADYSHTCHHPLSPLASNLSECEVAQYSSLDLNKDHIYFTLEPERPPRGITSPGISSYPLKTRNTSDDVQDSASKPSTPGLTTSPPPIYQEIPDLSTRRGRMAATRSLTHRGISVSNTTHVSVSSHFPHIQRSHSVPTTDGGSAQGPNQWALNRNVNIGTIV